LNYRSFYSSFISRQPEYVLVQDISVLAISFTTNNSIDTGLTRSETSWAEGGTNLCFCGDEMEYINRVKYGSTWKGPHVKIEVLEF
jgi:hypothetical protein